MGLLNRLFGGRFTQPPPDEPPLSNAAIMRELHPYRAELKAFTQALLASTPEKERNRLVRRVMSVYGQGEDPSTALIDGLLDSEKGQSLEYMALIAADWRDFDAFEHLARFLVKASGVEDIYVYQRDGHLTMEQVLKGFDQWLANYSKRFLHLNTGGEDHVGCIVDAQSLDTMVTLAMQAGIEAGLEAF